DIAGAVFAPASALNSLRRRAVLALTERLQARPGGPVRTVELNWKHISSGAARPPQLHLLVRSADQLEAAIAAPPRSITLDYLELYGLRPSVERIERAGIVARVASPRILKPAEERIVHFLRKLDCGILVRSTGLLHSFGAGRLTGDFSLNAANAAAAE